MRRTLFLSAAVPDPRRDPRFHTTADNIAIRDAVRALVTVAIPFYRLVWGGQPAITPFVRAVAQSMGATDRSNVTLYQSEFFRKIFPPDNAAFEDVRVTPDLGDREASLAEMRRQMFDEQIDAAVFIGGMEGIEVEFDLLQQARPTARYLPVASTGAAARFIYDKSPKDYDEALLNDYAYPTMFRRLLEIAPRR